MGGTMVERPSEIQTLRHMHWKTGGKHGLTPYAWNEAYGGYLWMMEAKWMQ
jgi:hypothetical protein